VPAADRHSPDAARPVGGLKMYGIASRKKHAILRDNGVTPIDYRTQDFTEVIRHSEPEGVDAVFNGMMSLDYIRRSVSVLKPKGKLVGYGEPKDLREFMWILWILLKVNLLSNRGSFKLYGTSPYFLGIDVHLSRIGQYYLDCWKKARSSGDNEKVSDPKCCPGEQLIGMRTGGWKCCFTVPGIV